MSATQEFNLTTKNQNFLSKKFKAAERRNSRQSTDAFCNIDFEYIGNTNNVKMHNNLSRSIT